MTKAELANKIAERAGIKKREADEAINAFTSVITEALSRGEKVTLVGFGTFETRQRAERKGRNPKTGEPLNIPSKRVPKFRAGAKLCDAIK